MEAIEKLKSVLAYVKDSFVGKDEIIDLLGIGLVARENAFLLGPPGTAKSAIVRQLANGVEGGKNFEYLLTRFTEPNEIFGPFDIRKLREGDLVTNTEGMLPEASVVFLDEIFNANSAILNSLLMALNERIFRRGKETRKLPALIFVGASNLLPEDESLAALLDRFLIRVPCNYVDTDLLESVLQAGWKLENADQIKQPTITPDELKSLQLEARKVDLMPVQKAYINLVHNLRNTGIKVSDRRAVKVQNLVAASALLSGRSSAILSDLWVLKYIWDTEDQIEILAGMVQSVIEKDSDGPAHPRAKAQQLPSAEELLHDIELIKKKLTESQTGYDEKNALKDKLRFIQNRVSWLHNEVHREQLQHELENLWKQLLQEV
ncbi:AAA domain-containing protein [bacterium]|nr:AAA domain-containing protein [bacterium]